MLEWGKFETVEHVAAHEVRPCMGWHQVLHGVRPGVVRSHACGCNMSKTLKNLHYIGGPLQFEVSKLHCTSKP